jgi:hypothetical protein
VKCHEDLERLVEEVEGVEFRNRITDVLIFYSIFLPMSTAMMIAQILGPMYLVVALGLWLNGEHFKKIFESFVKSEASLYMGGIMALIVGILIIRAHNVWVADWSVLITIIGYLATLKGVLLIVFPETVTMMWKKFLIKGNGIRVGQFVTLILGAFLTWMGYFA